ncbi:MAG: TonB-dependent receptor plug domain-containing protein, partial [Flavobacteriales bacterium]|nr:TonB-dependent receptor plug domain-containing protein [Flavobacteriales bacterium]
MIGLMSLAVSNYAQNVSVTIHNRSIQYIIEKIANKNNLHFSFSNEELDTITTSITAVNEPISKVLDRLLSPYGYEAKKSKGSFYYIRSKKKKLIFLVTSSGDNHAVSYAALRVKGTYRGGYANEDGVAELLLDREADSVLILSSVGYSDHEYSINENRGDTIKIEMNQDWQNLFQIEVHEYLNKAVQLKGDISNVSLMPEDMEVLPGLPEADILLSVQMLPGFESNNETASGLNIRGGSKDQGLIYWDGIPVYQAAHYFGTITAFIPTAVKEINTYKNYIPTRFTGATSGLLDITVYDSVPDQLEVTSNTTFTHSDLLLRTPVGKKVAVLLGGRISYNHLVQTPAFNAYSKKLFDGSRQEDFLNTSEDEEEELDLQIDSELRFWDFNGKIIGQLSNKDYISVSGIFNRDGLEYTDLNVDDSTSTDQIHQVQFSGLNLTYKRDWSHHWKSKLSASYSDYYMRNEFLFSSSQIEDSINDEIEIENKLSNLELKLGITYTGLNNGQIEFGYQFNNYSNQVVYNESFEYEQPLSDTFGAQADVHGVYLGMEKKIKEKLIFRPQIRVDYYNLSASIIVNPVLNLQYNIGKGFWFKSSYGHYSQALRSLNELDLNVSNVSESVWLLADNDEFDVLQSRQVAVGGIFKKKGWLIDVDLYYKTVSGLSALNQLQEEISGDLDFATGTSLSKGLDLMIKKKFGR